VANFSEAKLMKAKKAFSSWTRWLLVLFAMLLPARLVFAQDNSRIPMAFMGGFFVIFCIVFLVAYVYHALALQAIAEKTNTENAWLAWIPIVNLILMLNIAKKPIWWIILFFIPLLGFVMLVLVWMGIAEARGKPNWWGILIIVPVVNVIVPGYLAWAD
jgi:Family of unknown function (DUF5684)